MIFNPTDDQRNAINSKGPILVSAAAGSGKTAVLVEKIVSMILNKEISADRLMVVTFTNAAAAEFRSRIDQRIQKEVASQKDSARLEEQMMLLSNAYIGTTDSICLRLVREYFEILGVSPTVKVIDTGEFYLMKYNILTEIFKERYNSHDEALASLLKLFPGDIDDLQTKALLLRFYEKVANQISRENYLNNLSAMYNEPCFMHWLKGYNVKYINTLDGVDEKLENLAYQLDPESKLLPVIKDLANVCRNLLTALESNDYIEIFNQLLVVFKAKWPSVSKKAPKDIMDTVKSYKKSYDACVKALKKIYCYDTKTITESFKECKAAVNAIVEIMHEFINRLNAKLDENGYVSFEHAQRLALSLLRKFEDGEEVIPNSCEELVNRFDCVMVDEYQDTNNLQDYFFNAISNNGKNLFAVGDMKQSIYRFRGANPENFKKKQVSFADYEDADETTPRRIFLKSNFRSRKGVCDFVNYFFEGRMTEKVGSIDYSTNEKLNFEAKFPENNEPTTEIVLLNHQGVLTKVELEGEYIAKYIKEQMLKAPFLKNEKTGGLRKAKFGDFAVFVRTDMGNIETMAKVLSKYDIPFSVCGDAPLLSNEVITVLSLLKAINSKTDNISLISALVSPLFGYTMEEIGELKLIGRSCLYDDLLQSSKDGNKKASNTIALLKKIKHLSTSVSMGELVYNILKLTNFKEIVLSMDNGKVRANNLSLFEELAFSFDKNDAYSLPAFIAFCDKIAKTFTSDAKPNKKENTVKIMTMHKAKGLQYPICIIALNTKRFSNKESRESFLASDKLGVGFKYLNGDNVKISTPAFNEILAEDRAEQLSEEMRIYYVALTRAEEKLMVLISDNFENKTEEKDYMDKTKILAFSDWVLDAAFSSSCSNLTRSILGLPSINSDDGKLFKVFYEHANGDDSLDIYDDSENKSNLPYSFEKHEEIKEKFSYEYPYNHLRYLTAKTSVSNLVHKSNKYSYTYLAKPYFAEKGGLSSAEKGTALHKFMQYADFNKAKTNLNDQIEYLSEYGFLSEDEIKSLNIEQIKAFLESSLLNRALNSEKIYKEYKFISEIPAKTADPNLPDELNEENIIIQGAIDFMFIENDGIVIVDFKTDKMQKEEDFILVYKEQLDYYSLACTKIFNMPIKERYIYSLYLGKTIKL